MPSSSSSDANLTAIWSLVCNGTSRSSSATTRRRRGGRWSGCSRSPTSAPSTDACRVAAEHGLGWLDPGRSLQLHVSLVEQLPPLLRIYVGCAAVLYGDYRHADLVKIHIRSGKVSLMRYDDFEGQPLPRLVERVKIKLRDLDIDYFAYGEEYAPPFLFHKSRYINEEFPRYPEQVAFEQALDELGLFDLVGLWSTARRLPGQPGPASLEYRGLRAGSIPDTPGAGCPLRTLSDLSPTDRVWRDPGTAPDWPISPSSPRATTRSSIWPSRCSIPSSTISA